VAEDDIFVAACQAFGYRPERVLSIRITKERTVVAHIREDGDLATAEHAAGSVRARGRMDPGDGLTW
jgi:hypothetical protein